MATFFYWHKVEEILHLEKMKTNSMNTFKVLLISSIFIIGLSSCESSKTNNKEEKQSATPKEEPHRAQLKAGGEPIEKGDLKLYPAEIAKTFPDAELHLSSPSEDEKVTAGKVNFEFEVKNYQLREQTEGAEERHCANSEDGQHIHFILNNGPYQAKYDPQFEAELVEGNNVVLAFLSRSYHEGIKNGKAYVLKNFPIGTSSDFDYDAQHLFFSRPKGVYSGEDAERILVDFYLINSELSTEGNKVELTIDSEEFILDSWQPYFVEGLSKGEHQFRLRLIDQNGNLVPGPFNDSGVRTIEVER